MTGCNLNTGKVSLQIFFISTKCTRTKEEQLHYVSGVLVSLVLVMEKGILAAPVRFRSSNLQAGVI